MVLSLSLKGSGAGGGLGEGTWREAHLRAGLRVGIREGSGEPSARLAVGYKSRERMGKIWVGCEGRGFEVRYLRPN